MLLWGLNMTAKTIIDEDICATCAHCSLLRPPGCVVVPVEPTPEMWAAWDRSPFNEDDQIERNNAYRAMIAAAPQAKEQV